MNRSAACRLCGSPRLLQFLEVRGQLLDRCTHCTFVQVRVEPTAETLREIYSEAYFAHSKYRDDETLRLENLRRVKLLGRYAPEGSSVLDAGCSTGSFVTAAKSRFEMHGLDFSEFAIAQARAANPELAGRLFAGKLEDLPSSSGRFDAVCLWDVVEHLWDPVPVLRSLLECLRPGGHLLMSTPAIDTLVARCSGRYWAFMTPPEHLGFFTKRSFQLLFHEVLPVRTRLFMRRGKWTNIGFIGHKLRRIAPRGMPPAVLAPLFWEPLAKLRVYVPTGDIQYLVLQKT